MPSRLSFPIRTFNIIAPELIGMVSDVLLVAMSDRLVLRSATTPSAVMYIADRPVALPDHVIALDDSRRIS